MTDTHSEISAPPSLTSLSPVAVPVIKVPPHSQVNGTGSSLIFLCEVFAFPMALVEWTKEGRDVVLPGDDPHISVQVHVRLSLQPRPSGTDFSTCLIVSLAVSRRSSEVRALQLAAD